MKPLYLVSVVAVAGVVGIGIFGQLHARVPEQAGTQASANATVTRQDFIRSVRLSGTVEAVEATTIAAPRLAGQNNNSLVVMRLIKAGTTVKPGDPLIEFDRQEQIRNALDRRAELTDFEQQIKKRQADENTARATDDSTLKQAESARE